MRPRFIQTARSQDIMFALAAFEHDRDSPKVNMFCAFSKNHVYGQFFFEENVIGDVYLQMLQN